MRVTVAGFGGALAGLSFARRGAVGSAANVGRQTASTLSKQQPPSRGKVVVDGVIQSKDNGVSKTKKRLQRQRPIIRSTPPTTKAYMDRDLPSAWAVACTAFAGIIEFARVVSPTGTALGLIDEFRNKADETADGEVDDLKSTKHDVGSLSLDPSLITINDYMIGGAIAGALFKGSAVRTQVGSRIDASIMGAKAQPTSRTSPNLKAIRAKPLSGILPGAALGLVAGVAIVAMDRAQVLIEEKYGHIDEDAEDEMMDQMAAENKNDDAPIPADIKAMSNEELMRSIEELKQGKGGASSTVDNGKNHPSREMNGEHSKQPAPDLIYTLGFREHRA